ncbi:hypothetical protein BU52_18335 [Streptomyces toyocaensis]|uniref:DUF2282 domain-containing protein n=1 Tax=Streptomyces toyocaensis TaxID=55952 RepID=A0A081XQE2_STRTO|nr:hypothetical protein [Streptomyces toyocaensis]KES05765.1 hypothetical protein BU52_18335 [Streptomyces toyocaensis]
MIKSNKIVAAAVGILGSFALIGAGAVQATAAEMAPQCADDGKGNVRCVQHEYRVTTGEHGKLRVNNESTQNCTGSHGMTCVSSLTVPGERS